MVDGEPLQKVKLTSWKRTSRTLTTCIVVSWIGEAHMEELACCRGMQVYTRVPVEECASHRSIKTGWGGHQGDEGSPDFRQTCSERCEEERNKLEEEAADFSASSPPLDVVTFLLSETMTREVSWHNRPLKLRFF